MDDTHYFGIILHCLFIVVEVRYRVYNCCDDDFEIRVSNELMILDFFEQTYTYRLLSACLIASKPVRLPSKLYQANIKHIEKGVS